MDAIKATVSVAIDVVLHDVLGGGEASWIFVGNDDKVRSYRRRLEAVADVLEGFRAALMRASQRIQFAHDRRNRGL